MMRGQVGINEALPVGALITSELRHQYKIIKQIDDGGQGILYVVDGENGKRCFKQYKRAMLNHNSDFLNHIRKLISNGSPDNRFFVWPQEPVSDGGIQGYIMNLVNAPFIGLARFILPLSRHGIRFTNTKTTVDAMLNLISAFNILHIKGYSYQDLSLGNFMFNPEDGDLRIIDNDNVSINGENTGILGTPGFIAPEVLKGLTMPNTISDYYSLSVILFHILMRAHPLEGVRNLKPLLTPEQEKAMYRDDPVFMFDRDDARNRPSHELQGYITRAWEQLPAYFQGAFQIAMGKEAVLYEPKKRLDESHWEKVLIRLRNDFLTCPYCDSELVYSNLAPNVCPDCGKPIGPWLAFRTDFFKYPIPISYKCALMSANLRYCDIGKGNIKELEIKRSVKNHRVLIIHNTSGKRINIRRTDNRNESIAENGIIAVEHVKQIVVADGTIVTIEPLNEE